MMLKDLHVETPRAWKDFISFYQKLLETSNISLFPKDFLELPFEMQFGVFAGFFHENGLEVDVPQWDAEVLQSIVCETFRVQENMMGHFS